MHECTECLSTEENPYSTSLCKNHQIELQMSLLDYLENKTSCLKIFYYEFEHCLSEDDAEGIILSVENRDEAIESVKRILKNNPRRGYKDVFSDKWLTEKDTNEKWAEYTC